MILDPIFNQFLICGIVDLEGSRNLSEWYQIDPIKFVFDKFDVIQKIQTYPIHK